MALRPLARKLSQMKVRPLMTRRLIWMQIRKRHFLFCLLILASLFYLISSLSCSLFMNCEVASPQNVTITLQTRFVPLRKRKFGAVNDDEILDDNFLPIQDPEKIEGNLCDQNQTELILDTLITAVQLSKTWRTLYKTNQDRFSKLPQHFDAKMKPFFDKFKPFQFESNKKTRYFIDFKEEDAPCFMVLFGKLTL